MEKTASDILLEAATLLEEEGRWIQGQYVNLNKDNCAFCAHGAIAYCGNQKVRQLLAATLNRTWCDGVVEEIRTTAAARHRSNRLSPEGLSPEDDVRNRFGGEVGLAHYRAAQVGLSADYNDRRTTSIQDVIHMLRLAARTNSQ